MSTRYRRGIATFSCPVKCRRRFALLISFSSVWIYTTQHSGNPHFRLKQDRITPSSMAFGLTVLREHAEAAPPTERHRVMMGLKRRLLVRRIERYGLPAGLDATIWKRMQRMPDEEFLRHMRAIDSFGPDRGPDDWRDRREDFAGNRRRSRRF